MVDNFIFKIIHGTHLTKSGNAFLFADADGQHKGHNDGNDHAQRKAEHIGRLDGQNAGDAADADGVGRGGSSHAEQCVKLLNEDEEPIIRSATTYVIKGDITEDELEAIKKYCINPVDSRETGMDKPDTLVQKFDEPADVAVFDGFIDMAEAHLKELYSSLNLAMTFKDFLHIQNYFKNTEKRNPSVTEIRVLDTYWSDHCRHTTFSTELKNVKFDEGFYQAPIKKTYEEYLDTHKKLYAGRDDKFVCLMDLALLAMKRLKKEGKLADQEESDEINACSIVVPVLS